MAIQSRWLREWFKTGVSGSTRYLFRDKELPVVGIPVFAWIVDPADAVPELISAFRESNQRHARIVPAKQ